jgi:hypothetical protein
MENVTIKGKPVVDSNHVMRLNNGDLLLWCDSSGNVKATYLVVSFRKQGHDSYCFSTAHHCSLLDLDDGTLAFDEKCSRSTTINRILCHLNRGSYNGGTSHLDYANPYNQRLLQYKHGNFKIEIELLKEEI